MELFSLEDEDYSALILTQSNNVDKVSQESRILPDPMDFQSQCVSLISKLEQHYSDISDDDFTDIPCSQVAPSSTGDYQE